MDGNKYDMVRLDETDHRLVFDIRYATERNFLKKAFYPDDTAWCRRGTASKLKRVADVIELSGYRLKILDAYRPVFVQQMFWDVLPDSRYIANPLTGGSKHSRGCAVDLTLADMAGNELEMPSEFDDVTYRGGRKHATTLPLHVRENLALLTDTMLEAGFECIDSEWWHYCDSEWRQYPLVEEKGDNISI